MKSIDFSKPVTFKIVEGMLRRGTFTQLSLSSELGVSLGQANKVAKHLLREKMIEKKDSFYRIGNAQKIVGCIAQHREMKNLLVKKTGVSLSKEEVLQMLNGKGVLCLDSALERFVPNVVSQRVCVYAGKDAEKEVLRELRKVSGENCSVYVYREDLPAESVECSGLRVTEKVRTAIDLGCDNMDFAAKELFRELWKEKII